MSTPDPSKKRAQFHQMAQSTREDWMIIASNALEFNRGLADRVVAHLMLLDGDFGGFAVDRLTHCLQCATRAHRDGRDEEYVVCALLHDIGDTLGSLNHADIAAAIIKPFVSEHNLWMIEQHAIFQGSYFFEYIGLDKNMRERFRDHPAFAQTAEFCEKYDQTAFDPAYEHLPLSAFEPMVKRVFAAPKRSIYMRA